MPSGKKGAAEADTQKKPGWARTPWLKLQRQHYCCYQTSEKRWDKAGAADEKCQHHRLEDTFA